MTNTEIKVWMGRISRAASLQQEKHQIWKDSIDLYNCIYFDKLYGGIDPERVDVNFANWYIDNLVPLCYFRDPYIFTKPESDKYSAFASTMEKLVNINWRRLEMKQQMKRVIKSAFIMPPAWIKTGYTAKIGQDIAKIDEVKKRNLIKDIKDAITGIISKKPEDITPEEQGILNEYIEEESVFSCYISSWNVLMPEGYQVVGNMPYLIEIEDVTKIDFLANPFYKNKTNIKPNRNMAINNSNSANLHKPDYKNITAGADSETDIIRLYHIQDRRNRKNYTISASSDAPHFEGDWYKAKDGFDLEPLIFDESLPSLDKSNPYPANVIQPILPQIMEQSGSRTQMVKWRKRSSSLILAQRGLATEEDLRQLEETEAVQLLLVSNISAFQMSQTPALPNQIFDIDNIIKQDLQMGTNMGQMMFQAQAGQRTAAQAEIGQSGLQLKSSARVDVVEDFTTKIAKKQAYLYWNFYDRDKVSEIIGEEVTPEMWFDLPDDPKERIRIIQHELGLNIDAGSTAPPKDETTDRKQLLDFLSFAATFAPERLKKDELLKAGIKRWKFIKDIDKIVISNDEGEMQAAMQETQLMMQGAPQVISPNENHMIHIQEHQKGAGNPIVDAHIAEHGKFLGIGAESQGASQRAQQTNKPQAGDIRPPMKSTNPEVTRQSVPTRASVNASVGNKK